MAITGNQLKQLRRMIVGSKPRKKRTQQSLADLLDVDRVTVSNWERLGDDIIPRAGEKKIRAWAKGFQVQIGKEEGDKYSDWLPVAAAIAGGTLVGPLSGVLFGTAAAAVLAAQNPENLELEIKCPWCTAGVILPDLDTSAEYLCPYCRREFALRKNREPIRLGRKKM